MAKSNSKQLKVKLVRSLHGRRPTHQACIAGLGLRRLNHEVLVQDTPENRGMIGKVSYLLQVEEA